MTDVRLTGLRPAPRWRWWIRWGINETRLMFPPVYVNVATNVPRLPPGTPIILQVRDLEAVEMWVA